MEIPTWTGQTEDQRRALSDPVEGNRPDPRWVEQMLAADRAGALPQPAQIEAARQESAQVFNSPYTPTSYYAPAPKAQGGMMSGTMPSWLQGMFGVRSRGNDAVDMDNPNFRPMGPNSIGGFSLDDHQRLARTAGYTGEFGNGLFEAAQVADPSLRQRFTGLVDQFSQNAMAPMQQMPFAFGAPMFPGGQFGFGQPDAGNFYGDQQPMGWGQYDFGFGGNMPYGQGGNPQGALQPYGGYNDQQNRGAFQFARGGRVR